MWIVIELAIVVYESGFIIMMIWINPETKWNKLTDVCRTCQSGMCNSYPVF
jgi:hypothetical protein